MKKILYTVILTSLFMSQLSARVFSESLPGVSASLAGASRYGVCCSITTSDGATRTICEDYRTDRAYTASEGIAVCNRKVGLGNIIDSKFARLSERN